MNIIHVDQTNEAITHNSVTIYLLFLFIWPEIACVVSRVLSHHNLIKMSKCACVYLEGQGITIEVLKMVVNPCIKSGIKLKGEPARVPKGHKV